MNFNFFKNQTGTRVYVNSVSRVRIPLCPLKIAACETFSQAAFLRKMPTTTLTTTLVPKKPFHQEGLFRYERIAIAYLDFFQKSAEGMVVILDRDLDGLLLLCRLLT